MYGSLWSGRVVPGGETDPETEAIRALNDRLSRDPRVRTVLDPVGDGVTLAVKLPAWVSSSSSLLSLQVLEGP